jgi:hypothetical protein
MQIITSIQNPLIQEARSLHQKKGRIALKKLLIEGIRVLEMAHSAGRTLDTVFLRRKLPN